jgi:hypothetical protein
MTENIIPPVGEFHITPPGEKHVKVKSSFLKKHTNNPVTYIENLLESSLAFHKKDREREEKSHKFFTGLDFGQWSDAYNKLIDSGELEADRSQFNMIMKKVNGFVGSISKNPYDISFAPVDSGDIDSSQLLERLMLHDKGITQWDDNFKLAVRYAMIHNAYLKIGVTTKYNKFGNVSLDFIEASKVLTDPNWESESMKDCKWCATIAYLSPNEAMDVFPDKKQIISSKVNDIAYSIFSATPEDQRKEMYEYMAQVHNDRFRFITFHHMAKEKVTRRAASDDTGNFISIPNPPKELSDGTTEKEWLESWYTTNNVAVESIIETEDLVDVYYQTTVCSAFSMTETMDDDIGKVQVGRLPFFNMSFLRHRGRNIGFVDVLTDPQLTFNKRMTLINEILAKSAKDALLFDPQAFGNDQNKIRAFKKNANKPGFIMDTQPGYLENGGNVFAQVPKAPYPQLEIYNSQQMMDLINTITPQTQTMDGLNESSKETGRLFHLKKSQGDVNSAFVMDMIERTIHEIGEAYVFLCPQIYSGMYRKINLGKNASSDEEEVVELNVHDIDEDGREHVYNDVSLIPYQRVIVTESPKSVTKRASLRSSFMELLQYIPQEMMGARGYAVLKFVENLDSFSEKDLEELKSIISKDVELAKMNTEMQLQQLQAQTQQTQAQTGAMEQESAGEPPQEGGEPIPEDMMQQMV